MGHTLHKAYRSPNSLEAPIVVEINQQAPRFRRLTITTTMQYSFPLKNKPEVDRMALFYCNRPRGKEGEAGFVK